MFGFKNYNFKIHKNGIPLVLLFFVLFLIFFNYRIISYILLIKLVLLIILFRDEDRVKKTQPGSFVSPCDGKIVSIEKTHFYYSDISDEEYYKISIFMDLSSSRVQYFPMDGMVVDVIYSPGRMFNIFDKHEEDREKNFIIIEGLANNIFGILQSSKIFSKMIDCNLRKNEVLVCGHNFGLLKMSDMTEIYIPSRLKLDIQKGQRVVGGETEIVRKITPKNEKL